MCTCQKDVEAMLLERFKSLYPEAAEPKVRLQGYSLVIADGIFQSVPCMPIKTTANYPLKKGGAKFKSTTSSMFFNYCPFCGEKIKKGVAA